MKKLAILLLSSVLAAGSAWAASPGGAGPGVPLAPPELPRFVTQGSSSIACASTPFGRHAVIGEDAEFVSLSANSGSLRAFDVFAPGPENGAVLVREFGANLLASGNLSGTTFLSAREADLDGDGRDEIVTVHRVNTGGTLRLGVFRRGVDGTVSLLQTWSLARSFSHVELVAGDLDGSTDGKQELGLLVRGMSPAALEVYVLTGNAQGQIAENTNGGWAGRWVLTGVFGQSSLAVGDMILSGREQLVLVNESGTGGTRALNYHLLEFQPSTPALPVGSGNSAIGSVSFPVTLGTGFQLDNGNEIGITQLHKLKVLAGDITDSAAAELMVMVVVEGSSNFNQLVARMNHFTTVRDFDNNIQSIDFFRRDPQRPWDSSFPLSSQNQGALIKFDATFANIDQVSPSELVMAFSEEQGNRINVQAHKAGVEVTAGFQWRSNGLTVNFADRSTGRVVARSWNFGDGSGALTDLNPTYTFPAPVPPATSRTFNVTLTVTGFNNQTATRTHQVTVSTVGSNTGGAGPETRYILNATPTYASFLPVDTSADINELKLAVGDMDRRGVAEVMTVANDRGLQVIRSVWRLLNTANPASFSGRHLMESPPSFSSDTALAVLAADSDGDSVRARLGTDCRQVEEPQIRQLVWLPPYFERLQGGAEKLGSFGETTSGSTSNEKRAGSFTSHDVSAYVGVGLGFDAFGLGVEASVKATAGYNYQANYGAIHGTENSFSLDQSFSQGQGEALMVIEENTFRCYTYDVATQAAGTAPNSGMRMCEVLEDSRLMSASDAAVWDSIIPASGANHPPAQWMPVHRDWASLSLFQDVTTNVQPEAGSAVGNVTDGRFSTWLSTAGPTTRPYVQIDLGEVRDISNIRVFPRAGGAIDLKGFRLYASEAVMTGDAVPSGAGVRSFAPETGDDMPYDRWNVWTRDRQAPSQLMRARYIRLQHPGSARLNVAQIQVFGDVHVEPQYYPQAVCDPMRDDNLFLAQVWNPRTQGWASVESRGQILWNGAGDMLGCSNFANMQRWDIWANLAVGNSGTSSWNLSQEGGTFAGDSVGFESSTRVGAEFDVQAGFIVSAQGGGAYEYGFGVTEEVQTMQYWGSGLEMGGAIGGFAPEFANLVQTCRYTPRPYAYRLIDVSNTGYEHTVFVVDYAVRQGPSQWQRSSVPQACKNVQLPPEIFDNGFE